MTKSLKLQKKILEFREVSDAGEVGCKHVHVSQLTSEDSVAQQKATTHWMVTAGFSWILDIRIFWVTGHHKKTHQGIHGCS